MKSARMQKKAGNNVMGMIRAAGLGYEYLRYEEEGQEPEVTKAIEDVSLEIQKGQFIAVLGHNGMDSIRRGLSLFLAQCR